MKITNIGRNYLQKMKKNKDIIYDIMSITQDNYGNMLKRLDRNAKFSNLVLIYYSIALIIYSITAKFFPKLYCGELSGYFSIIISVVVLAYSLINSNANYQERKKNAENVLNKIKDLKRDYRREKDGKKKEKIYIQYKKITNESEYRSDVDFFRTIKQRCKKNHMKWYKVSFHAGETKLQKEKKIEEYLCEISPFVEEFKLICDYLLRVIIMFLPVVLFIICFLFTNKE